MTRPALTGPTFFAGVFVLAVSCLLAVKHAFDDRYPRHYWQCPHCPTELSSRNPIELNRAKGEHLTGHAARNDFDQWEQEVQG